ncbi:MAG: serine hydrolase, partial [Candidatus Eremiobacteraeota bacterium]|nr:serine hydrolase [Candidatus Eremiobacteraeota bacterium]
MSGFEAAAEYAERHALQVLFALREDRVVFERYAPGWDAGTAHPLYSGTKSFWGVAAVAAQADGILDLDEPVGETFASWSTGERAAVTLRMLLQLTSGIGFGGLGAAVPTYDKALEVPLKSPPGARFTYGGIPLQVFGAVLEEKLGRSAHDYLRERILEPIGLRVGSWRTLHDGRSPLPTGAFVSAEQWARFGRLVRDGGRWSGKSVVPAAAVARCFEGSAANARYGLCWWLSPLPEHPAVVYASGAGGQALYVVPSLATVVVKFGNGRSYRHEAFLSRLLGA